MKKGFSLLVILMTLCMVVCSCSNAKEEARKQIELEVQYCNQHLAGTQIDYMTKMISCSFDGTNMTYIYEIDEDYATISDLNVIGFANEMKTTLYLQWRNNSDLQEIKKALKTLKGNVKYIYVGSYSRQKITVTIDMD